MQLFAGNDLGIGLRHLLFLDHLNPNWKGTSVYQKKYSDLGSTLTKHLGTCFNMNSTIHMNSPTADSKAPFIAQHFENLSLIQIPQIFELNPQFESQRVQKYSYNSNSIFPAKWKQHFLSPCLQSVAYLTQRYSNVLRISCAFGELEHGVMPPTGNGCICLCSL